MYPFSIQKRLCDNSKNKYLGKHPGFRNNNVSEKQIGLKTNGRIVSLKDTTNCWPFGIADRKLLRGRAARSRGEGADPTAPVSQGSDASDPELALQKFHETHYFSHKCAPLLTNEFGHCWCLSAWLWVSCFTLLHSWRKPAQWWWAVPRAGRGPL